MATSEAQKTKWTPEQQLAIDSNGRDILVAAAAGSGKTAVLIERLIQKVLDKDNPVDVDQLLVVTFTNASAAEMRSRMAEALEKEIAKAPDSRFLRRQLSLIGKAQISTLHSFCLTICRQYAYMIDLDPGFRIASQDEVSLLRDDVLMNVLERAYGGLEETISLEEMYTLVDSFTSDRSDQQIEQLVDKLYEMSRVQPAPYEWLKALPNAYDIPADTKVDELFFIDEVKAALVNEVMMAKNRIDEMNSYANEAYGLQSYVKVIEADKMLLNTLLLALQEGTWQEVYELLSNLKWATMPRLGKNDDFDEAAKEKAMKLRNSAKDIITKKIKTPYFSRSPERLLEEMRMMKPIIETLVHLTIVYSEAFKAAKLEKGLVDFSDLEHYALEILTDEDRNPSTVAKDFQERFKEVLVDEYQDVNMLQETILQLVKIGDTENGNMFMVGDVKQSIYAFRLAEPRLFMDKYKQFQLSTDDDVKTGLKIDLNANFRSRKEVLTSTNHVFEQLMDEAVGEINYDEKAALKFKASYNEKNVPVELVLLNGGDNVSDAAPWDGEEVDLEAEELESLQTSQQEARYMISRIQQLVEAEYPVFNPKDGTTRPIRYSDIVILMRSMTWASELSEEFKAAGIPLYAESSKGYFDALEVMIMLNLLKVIDNPYQDIPLVSVLRAPFIGLTENELAEIRLAERNVPFYQALKTYLQQATGNIHPETLRKLEKFLEHLRTWRAEARRGPLADLIWDIYLKTNYYEMVGAMANGKQRQANLRALHDRALAYEKTSFRGLFRFLRFIDRMKSRGDDLGIAKSIGEADNVVRLVTIHSSKGLEFPVVFVAGLGRQFNMMDFHGYYLFDQDFGMAVKAVHPQDRVMYTSLPYLALKNKRVAKMKAEEMRILYVAMTRAKEKLILVGSVNDWDDTLKKWSEVQELPEGAILPNHIRAGAKNYLDWIGPAVARHEDFKPLLVDEEESAEVITDFLWKVEVVPSGRYIQKKLGEKEDDEVLIEQPEVDEALVNELTKRFTTVYPYMEAVNKKSKTSVSEIKRYEAMQRAEEQDPPFNLLKQSSKGLIRRPMFIQEKKLSGTERGTVVHTVMQHVPQQGFESIEQANVFLNSLVERQLLHQREAEAIDMEDVMKFFASSIGERFKQAVFMLREVPFTLSRTDREGDAQIVQGIIDCLFKDQDGRWVLLDYKTDRIRPPFNQEPALTKEMQDRYSLQLAIYEEAIQTINQIQIDERLLYLYDIGEVLAI